MEERGKMKKTETKKEQNFELTTAQFETFIVPFFEEAKKENRDLKLSGLKLLKVNKIADPVVESDVEQDQHFRLDYKIEGKEQFVILCVRDAKSLLVSGISTAHTMLIGYITSHRAQLEDALREYVYSIYGEEYKDYLIELARAMDQKERDFAQRDIETIQAHIAAEKAKLKALNAQLQRAKERKNSKEEGASERIKKIENLLNSHHV